MIHLKWEFGCTYFGGCWVKLAVLMPSIFSTWCPGHFINKHHTVYSTCRLIKGAFAQQFWSQFCCLEFLKLQSYIHTPSYYGKSDAVNMQNIGFSIILSLVEKTFSHWMSFKLLNLKHLFNLKTKQTAPKKPSFVYCFLKVPVEAPHLLLYFYSGPPSMWRSGQRGFTTFTYRHISSCTDFQTLIFEKYPPVQFCKLSGVKCWYLEIQLI